MGQECQVGLQYLKVWMELEKLCPRWCTHMAVDRKPQSFATRTSPQAAWCVLKSLSCLDPREKGWSCSAFYEMAYNHVQYMLYTGSKSPHSSRGALNSTFWREEYHRICGHSLRPSPEVYGFALHASIKSNDLLSHKSVHYIFLTLNFNWLHWPCANRLTTSLDGLWSLLEEYLS